MKDILRWLVWGGLFLIPLLPLLVTESLFYPYVTGKNFAFRVIVEVIFSAWIGLALLDKQFRPRFSWLLPALVALLASVGLSAALGVHPPTSLWSNYERMDGLVTLVHLVLFVVVLGSVLKDKAIWSRFLNLSIGVALLTALHGLAQHGGLIDGGGRIAGTLGNAAYMAVYLLFHIFFAIWLFVRTNDWHWRGLYLVSALVFAYVLLLTGTRGTFLALVSGSLVSVCYVALFGWRWPTLRRVAVIGLIAAAFCAGTFFLIKDSNLVQSNGALARIANIDLDTDLAVRGTIWRMAYEGVKERPLLGWGHGNFNFVFNQQYDPSLHSQEAWFDRAHNIFLDWLIYGGVIGLFIYLSIFAALFYYLLWRPYFKQDNSFDVLERAVLIGLVMAYLVHNLVVFDNLISYIFFGVLLAIVHNQVARPLAKVEEYVADPVVVKQFVLPALLILASLTIYFVNVPSLLAARDLLGTFRTNNVTAKLESFEQALARGGWGRQEIVEQMSQQAISVSRADDVPREALAPFFTAVEEELVQINEYKPDDARLKIFTANFYRATGQLDEAAEAAAEARVLSPDKQTIIIEQAIIAREQADDTASRELLREAFEFDPEFPAARTLYAVSLFENGEYDEALALLTDPADRRAFALDTFAVASVERLADPELYEFMVELFQLRVEDELAEPRHRVHLAFAYYRLGEAAKAIAVLREMAELHPSVATEADCVIDNIEQGRRPEEGC